ncbi:MULTISPECIES: LuxR C-terminal-related transcriptional regulator [unclassified Streptomyces]|uniref:helix-turn-helix transcriptional regulator n=1 Tax=unclassified Streptomyces TaxID=2593676 RepID=UPI0036564C7E
MRGRPAGPAAGPDGPSGPRAAPPERPPLPGFLTRGREGPCPRHPHERTDPPGRVGAPPGGRVRWAARTPVVRRPPDPRSAEVRDRGRQEHRVEDAVTEGLTTPAIAARLYLSPRTVDTHLAHIYGKTGVTTRTAPAAPAARSAPTP